ncbi:hypothetical protein P175DRAFT_0529950 [Aspergillus ochraceoroseus IBT 24754]|uniref:Choline kinase N-terminal domain-containing protein n=3 Tax=Aspergillus subgen. Nidulantes TaxID=2720870 RepID=A0A0F8U4J6_9EURO|nr:uncharacterized protein P175DRAFT_0529950 [Aspergillus ochraceoroseus IBT 24754]KKK12957.1 hypothetical protein AOCH_004854 [Aspergillus ochraceoroseus]KKK14543.1 hypothetical protein ARAM_006336 [Aspergillus rambellii]PTU22864.1 hypothetical protein P175DRAFT_0529950 [Aspergillus ochraceoroseus IBT 24754]
MPSFTDEITNSGAGPEGPHPVLGNGLTIITPLQKNHQANGNGDSAPPEIKQHRMSTPKVTARQPLRLPSPFLGPQSSQPSGVVHETVTKDDISRWLQNGDEEQQRNLFSQVHEWLVREKSRRKVVRSKSHATTNGAESDGDNDGNENGAGAPLARTASQSSDTAAALDKLEKILTHYAASRPDSYPTSTCSSRRSTRRRHPKGLRRGSASDSDYTDYDPATPSVDAVLDNSKTLAYSGGAADGEEGEISTSTRRAKDKEAWVAFKSEILRLAHTLQLKGWRKVSMEIAPEMEVVRLSGALTNAVYMVTPPQNLPPPRAEDGSYTLVPRRPPSKLLLRIYGPQVDHLIDREKELQILRRLGRKNIGPKVLGTFINGRFEEYFEARPLTARELRDPLTMRQIAKRMRELHEGVDLLEEERAGGPMVFQNWDKWLDRCERVTSWLDKEIESAPNESKAAAEPWRRRGYVCGVPWPTFRKAVEDYRKWLVASCGGINEIKRQLVFAHNDTQYGNLLRMEPQQQSPLMLPENKHKQLVVIDFEYASANMRGLEFANHFTEWCYNYHDEERPWACSSLLYPTLEQQHRFITAYLAHRPGLSGLGSPSITPLMRPLSIGTPTMAPLDLDAGPDADLYNQDLERTHQETLEAETQYLLQQTRLWRVANSAQWVAWGIVQAKVPELGEKEQAEPTSPVDGEGEADEFDYLAYAQDRAMFFWADLLSLGVVQKSQLPQEMVKQIESRVIDD